MSAQKLEAVGTEAMVLHHLQHLLLVLGSH
jgi:hypothetical protein